METAKPTKNFTTRLTDHYKATSRAFDNEFPAEPHFENYLTGVHCNQSGGQCFNFSFTNGLVSKLSTNGKATEEIQIKPVYCLVAKIHMWYFEPSGKLCGFQLFDREGTMILETPPSYFNGMKCKETLLAENERIVGFRSRQTSGVMAAWHLDFQFVIGV